MYISYQFDDSSPSSFFFLKEVSPVTPRRSNVQSLKEAVRPQKKQKAPNKSF